MGKRMDGICTLANDRVLDQTIALLNSIEATMGPEFPVCIFPYDDRCDRLAEVIQARPQVQIFRDRAVLAYWDHWARAMWDACPQAKQRWQEITTDPYYRFGTHRRLAAFYGPFDRFLYMDADTLLLQDVRPLFQQLTTHDWIVYDFQHRDLSHVYNHRSSKLSQVFANDRLAREIFCSGFYAAKRDTFSETQLQELLTHLQSGESEILYCMAPDQTLLNYWVMRSNLSVYNLALELPLEAQTGCCVTSDHFVYRDRQLYDHEVPLTYLHYIGLSSSLFQRLCAGENLALPYRDIFLQYRYWHDPSQQPRFVGKPRSGDRPPLADRILKKLCRTPIGR
ncbi:Npun_R2821/Npun_R2822 family protein [Alkalinema sp. FACHB-956]|uniref:Npun_R2821/Npun_R2822 family protein n=1 Tax=Alkalinema sp. FACHB-956 TaxID=2692768 RepID=UPI001F55585E|nr:Npun_R2821/Npun_R2822 family protein [Alkalinema sp. FACHB-956]